MTTTNPDRITPEEWRTAAKVARRSIFGNNELADAWENVAKYSAAANLTTQLAKAYRAAERAVAPIQCEWDQLPEDYQELGKVGIRGVLEFLTSTGRLLADDEMRLTAEQVLDLKNVLDHGHPKSGQRLLDALFPATESAECEYRCEEGIASAGVGVRCPACTAAIRDKEAIEPAEEETKAEGSCVMQSPQGDFCSFPKPDHAGVHTWAWPDKEPTSSPVVLAPTETGPWQIWQEVPEGVPFKSHNGMDVVWRREGALVWFKHFRQDARDLNDLAPFVAAEEG